MSIGLAVPDKVLSDVELAENPILILLGLLTALTGSDIELLRVILRDDSFLVCCVHEHLDGVLASWCSCDVPWNVHVRVVLEHGCGRLLVDGDSTAVGRACPLLDAFEGSSRYSQILVGHAVRLAFNMDRSCLICAILIQSASFDAAHQSPII